MRKERKVKIKLFSSLRALRKILATYAVNGFQFFNSPDGTQSNMGLNIIYRSLIIRSEVTPFYPDLFYDLFDLINIISANACPYVFIL